MVRRREFLAAGVGAGTISVAGCVGEDALTGSSDRELTLAGVEDAPEQGIELDVELDAPSLDGGDPPELHLEFENVGETTVRFIAPAGFYAGALGASSPGGLVALAPEEADDRSDPGFASCWSIEELDRGETSYFGEVAPGEGRSGVVYVFGDERDGDDSCPDTGEYTFTTTYTVDGDGGREVECSITLEVHASE